MASSRRRDVLHVQVFRPLEKLTICVIDFFYLGDYSANPPAGYY